MGAGSRYNTNTQRGNPQPSPNCGGGHTGNGKYRHGGFYSHGFRLKRRSHLEFTPEKKVEYIGSHKDFEGTGTVMSHKPGINKSRSTIRVKMDNTSKIVYINKRCLILR
jgi:hypothetical protein